MIPSIEDPGGRRLASAALWGAVGVMSVLVAVQGYALLAEPLLSIPRAAALALAVGVATTAVVYATERRVAAWAAWRAGRK
ncbi:hypothetical protein [Saliphagus sp. LR7]|uniref:hypothetical protein n=1 Tax=Saliphagus sp. LR7 TaxID=2282654 RepID=UPI000DF8571C|nr:hypothetical protein [Saliphagus sp. LR7]